MYKKIDEKTRQKIIEMTEHKKTKAEIKLECHVGDTIIKQVRREAELKYEGRFSKCPGGTSETNNAYDGGFTDVAGGDTSEDSNNENTLPETISPELFEKLVDLVINEINAMEELSAKIEELSASTAHIGHASIDVLDDKCSKEFVIRIKKCGDDPQREEVCTYEEALSLLMEYTNLDEDNLRKRLDLYNQQKEQDIGNRVTLIPNHGQKFKTLDNDVKDWKEAYQKLNERINSLENKL